MKMNDTNWVAIAREGNKRDRQGQYAVCSKCGESDPRALRTPKAESGSRPKHRGVVCAEHHLTEQGKSPMEEHHPAGRANDPFVVRIPANDHAILSDMQHDWPVESLRNPDGSPLLRAAASLRGWLDILRLVIERTVGWIPEFLEWLDDRLRVVLGERCWDVLGWDGGAA
jgi:hypothetical protein